MVSVCLSQASSGMRLRFTLLLSAATILLSCVHSYCVCVMNLLPLHGVHPDLSRSKFTELLSTAPITSLRALRVSLFDDACAHGLMPDGLNGLPLVDRRDSALRPASKVLSNDIWIIVQFITNKECVPRTLLKIVKGVENSYQKEQPSPCYTNSVTVARFESGP